MRWRRLLFTGVLVLLPSLSFGQQTLIPITVAALSSPDVATLHYALEHGLFEKAGLDVQLVPSQGSGTALPALLGGSVQIAMGNILSVAQAHQRGAPVLLLAPGGGYDSRQPSAALLILNDSPIRTPKDLEGKTVAITSLHDLMSIAVEGWLEKGGVDFSQVHFIEMSPGSMLAALQRQRVDAMVVYEPFLSDAIAGGAKAFAKPYDSIAPAFLVTAYFTTSAWATEHHDAAIKFAQIMNATSPFVNAHFPDMIPMVSSFSNIPVEKLRGMAPPFTPPSLAKATIQPVINAAAKYHEIPSSFPVKELIVPGAP